MKKKIIKKYYCDVYGGHIKVTRENDWEFTEYDSKYLTAYIDDIQKLFDKYIPDGGLAKYLYMGNGFEAVDEDKVESVLLKAEVHFGKLYASFIVILKDDFVAESSEEFLYGCIEGQTFAGVGESIENGYLHTDIGELIIHLWKPEWKLYREKEFHEMIEKI